jgi:hypothetical protein
MRWPEFILSLSQIIFNVVSTIAILVAGYWAVLGSISGAVAQTEELLIAPADGNGVGTVPVQGPKEEQPPFLVPEDEVEPDEPPPDGQDMPEAPTNGESRE